MPSKNLKPPLYLMDAYGFIYRSHFAFLNRPLRNNAGKNVSILFDFSRVLVNFLDKGVPAVGSEGTLITEPQKPLRFAVVFDSTTPTFRHKLYSEYKAKRQKSPDEMREQIPLIKELLTTLKVPMLQVDGYEADDIIATLAQKCKEEGRQCYIFSSDKDLLQLVDAKTYVLEPSKKSDGYNLVGEPEVKEKWGTTPDKILELLSLMGDSSDNVPGVKGIGEVSAVKLITRYGSIDEIYKNIAGIEGATGKKLAEGKDMAYFSRKLIELEYSVPLSVNTTDELSVENIDRGAGASMLLREGVQKIALLLEKDAKPEKQKEISVDDKLLGEGVYKTILDIEELKKLLDKAEKQGFFALDFETDNLDSWLAHPVGISLAVKEKEGFYIPLAAHEGTSPFVEPEEVRNLLVPFFENPAMTIIAHNAKYDYGVSLAWGVSPWKCKIWDTMIAAWILDPERNNYSLDSLVSSYFGYTSVAYKDIVPKDKTFDVVPLETATRYSGEDADLCFRMYVFSNPRLESGDLRIFHDMEMPLIPLLDEMEREGILIEKHALRKYGLELSKELDQIQSDTYRLVGHEFNLSSTKQLQDVLFVERKLHPVKKTKTGYSTDVDVLEELAKLDDVPLYILRHRTLSKLKSTYIDGLVDLADSEDRLHTSLIQTGTATGRLSSRKPNLQNIPIRDKEGRRIREAFIAKPDHLLISADYSQIELVVLAHLSGDKNLISAFENEKDIHAQTASLIFGTDESKVTPEQRRMAKTINFGVMYGMSAFRLSNELNISRTDAALFIDAYFKTYSGVRTFIDDLIKKTEETGYVTTIFGRKRYIPSINSQNKTEKEAASRVTVNTPIQGSAADIVKTAMLNLDKALKAEKSSAKLLLQVHDELILEVPSADADKAAETVKREMENAVKLKVPLKVSVEKGKRWGDFH